MLHHATYPLRLNPLERDLSDPGGKDFHRDMTSSGEEPIPHNWKLSCCEGRGNASDEGRKVLLFNTASAISYFSTCIHPLLHIDREELTFDSLQIDKRSPFSSRYEVY